MGRYADGDPRAFEYVYNTLAPVVTRCLYRWVSDGALVTDLTQETFLRVHRARDRYRRGAPVGPWVITIARRLSIDALRRRAARRDRLTRDGAVPEQVAPVADEPTPKWLVDEVRAAIEALPESQRVVVAMHKLDGQPLAAVASALGINEGAARVRAHRGYKRLRTTLAGLRSREE